jgi:superfamily I DNA/RNA helicase
VRFVVYKDFRDSLSTLHERGGRYQKIAGKVFEVIGKTNIFEGKDPFEGVPVTNHGEHRIKHCIKRQIGDGCRLITINNNGVTALCFAGTHEDCDKWLDRNRGLELTMNKKGEIEEILTSTDIKLEDKRVNTNPGLSGQPLIKKISARHIEKIAEEVNWSIMQRFSDLKSSATEDEILDLSCEIEDTEKQNAFFDVFSKLREDDVEGAIKSIELYINDIKRLDEIDRSKAENLPLSDSFIDYDDLEPELFEHYVKTANFKKWMLFMHPEQRKLVERNFNGPAKLIGVSGSGKTAIVIKRAVYLASQYPTERILVLTLNRALSSLIEELIDEVCPDKECRGRIDVYSFWKFCQIKLKKYSPDKDKLYNDYTWKTKEDIDQIWEEYFECKLNNEDARVLNPVNRSLLSRSVYPKDYIRQEYDWIRSAFSEDNRLRYIEIERHGRTEPFSKDFRMMILKGLDAWENKMEFVGGTDYLGLSTELHKYRSRISHEYRCVLVDEVQDFGTVELDIIRQLVSEKENDLFLCGDIAQQVCFKHHKLSDAGINVVGRSHSIKKNYRNSREILKAAYCVLEKNVDLGSLRNDDFEILEPEYANFSTPKPLLLKAGNLDEEFGYCLNYLKNNLEKDKKACMAICGYSLFDVKDIGTTLNIPVLDGDTSLEENNIFLSDLEQTKGFEFDIMFILNCNRNVIPNPMLPEGEWYREISKFYVAMTRAKSSLLISYSAEASDILKNCRDYFVEAEWQEHEGNNRIESFHLRLPMMIQNENDETILKMTGSEFLYTRMAAGISAELYDKLSALIDGKGATLMKAVGTSRTRKKVRWKNIGEAIEERDIPAIAQLFGAQKTWPEFKALFKKHFE